MNVAKSAEIIIPTDEQQYALWELVGVYTQLKELSKKMTDAPAASLSECEQFTKNVKAVLSGGYYE